MRLVAYSLAGVLNPNSHTIGEAGVVPKYKGDEWKGPTWPKPADEPSISWTEFIKVGQSC